MENATNKEKAYICAFIGTFLQFSSFLSGEKQLEAIEEKVIILNSCISYFGVDTTLELRDVLESKEKILNLFQDMYIVIGERHSVVVLHAFGLGCSAAFLFCARFKGYLIDEKVKTGTEFKLFLSKLENSTLPTFNNLCEKLSIDEQTKSLFLETLEPMTFVEAFHKIQNMRTINAGTYIENNNGVININMSEDLASVALQIQSLIDRLQQQGKSPEEAEKEVAQDIATQAQNDPTAKEKLVKWGQSIGTATVTDVVKGAVKLAIRLAGIPIP
jgi:hypothetical protein